MVPHLDRAVRKRTDGVGQPIGRVKLESPKVAVAIGDNHLVAIAVKQEARNWWKASANWPVPIVRPATRTK